jgi:hypothetical protein
LFERCAAFVASAHHSDVGLLAQQAGKNFPEESGPNQKKNSDLGVRWAGCFQVRSLEVHRGKPTALLIQRVEHAAM